MNANRIYFRVCRILDVFRKLKAVIILLPAYLCSSYCLSASDIIGSGSGFYITNDGYVLTNNHVVEKAEELEIVSRAGTFPAKVIKTDKTNDIALLKFEPKEKVSFLSLGKSGDVELGDHVFTIGFPNPQSQGKEPKYTEGTISSLSGLQDEPNSFQVSVPVQPGNSGGPLISGKGEVVGMVFAKLNGGKLGFVPENVNYAIKSSYIKLFLDEVKGVTVPIAEIDSTEKSKREIIDHAESCSVQILIKGTRSASDKIGGATKEDLVLKNGAAWLAAIEARLEEADTTSKKIREQKRLNLMYAGAIRQINIEDPWKNYSDIRDSLPPNIIQLMTNYYNFTKTGVYPGIVAVNDAKMLVKREIESTKRQIQASTDECDRVYDSWDTGAKKMAWIKIQSKKLISEGYLFNPVLPKRTETENSLLEEQFEKCYALAKKGEKFSEAKVLYRDENGIFFLNPDNGFTAPAFQAEIKSHYLKSEGDDDLHLIYSAQTSTAYIVRLKKQ